MTVTPEQIRESAKAFDSFPSPGCDEFVIGATDELDVDSIGGYPVRRVVVVAGTGTLKYTDPRCGEGVLRTATCIVGTDLQPLQITSIRGTNDGSSALTIRVYK